MDMTKIILWIARLGPAGLSPIAPGTCGSLVAILLAPFFFMPLSFSYRLVFLLIIALVGTYAAGKAEIILDKEDPQEVVVDELLGQWITCLPFVALSPAGYAAAFILFRIFDISKPKLVKRAEDLPGGFGIMADDVVAGVLAMICLALLYFLLPGVFAR